MDDNSTKSAAIRGRVLRSTASNYAGQFLILGLGFFLTPFILHRLGPTEFGLWALVGSVVRYGTLLDFGIAGAVIKYVAEYRARGEIARAQSLIATALCLYVIIGLVAIALALAIAPVLPHFFHVPPSERVTATRLMLLAGLAMAISIVCATPLGVLRGLQRFDIVNLITSVATLVGAAATVAVLLLGGGVLGMVAAGIPITLLMQIPSIWFINRLAPELRFGWRGAKRSLLRTVLGFSSSIFVVQVADQLQTKTDEMVIGTFLPITNVTPYAIARRLSDVPQVLTNQFLKILMPLASELHAENDWDRLRALYIVSTRLTLAICLPVTCVLAILARPILTVWVGPAYGQYAPLIVILTLAGVIDTSQWPAGSLLQGIARYRLLAVMALGSGIANLALSLVLVSGLGITGVALGTLIASGIECLGFVLPYALRVIGVSWSTAIREIFLPALLPAVPVMSALYLVQRMVESMSLLAIVAIAGGSALLYAAGYLRIGASAVERRAYHDIARNVARIARVYVSRS